MSGRVRFFTSRVGGRIAYTTTGSGPPLVMVPPWVGTIEQTEMLSGAGAFYEVLARRHTVVRFDRWGTGLSDRDRTDLSLDADVDVAVELLDALHVRRAAVFAPSQSGPLAIELALRRSKAVSHLVLYAIRAHSLPDNGVWEASRDLLTADWSIATRAIAAMGTPGAAPGDIEAFADSIRRSASPEVAVGLQDASMLHDTWGRLSALRVPTLVLHRRDDQIVPVEAARSVASRVPGALLEVLEGDSHVLFIGDSAAVAERVVAFTAGEIGRSPSAQLTTREEQVLELIATGSSNAEAAEQLDVSARTIERHLLNAYRKLGVRSRAEAAARWRGGLRTTT